MVSATRKRLWPAVGVVAATALAVWYANQIAPHIRDQSLSWSQDYLFPLMTPVGADFLNAVYLPGAYLRSGIDPYTAPSLPYPPFSVLAFLPYQAVTSQQAYSIHIVVVILLTLASIAVAMQIAHSINPSKASSQAHSDPEMAAALFLSLAILTVNSYGFTFGVERGNFDIYPLALSLSGLWVLTRSPHMVWPQAVCFSVAAHLKVYPAVLFVLLFWKHGRKALAPLLVANAALLFSIGPVAALSFFERLLPIAASPATWVGNHSAASFSLMANGFLGARGLPTIPSAVFLGIPTAIWLASAIIVVRRGYSNSGALWLFTLSVPLMNLIPSTSHDYRIVLLSVPSAMLLVLLLERYIRTASRLHFAEIIATCVLLFFLSVSYVGLPSVLGNKYPFIIAMQLLMLLAILTVPSRKEAHTFHVPEDALPPKLA